MAAMAASLSVKLSFVPHLSSPLLDHSSPSLSSGISAYRSKPHPASPLLPPHNSRRNPRVFAAVVEKEKDTCLGDLDYAEDEKAIFGSIGAAEEPKRRARPCELYVCNLPRSYGISHMIHLFKPYGTVLAVEVSRDTQTGISRGCGYVTMSSISEAKFTIAALDGSDIAGREMRVKFSADMVSARKNAQSPNSAPKKNIIFESPYKIYVGNLSRSTKPQDLMEHFSQFGTIISTRVLHDCKRGKNRAYAFISFSTPDEAMVATEANGSELCGRVMTVRDVFDQEK